MWDVAGGACRRVLRVLRPLGGGVDAAERELPSALSQPDLGGSLAPAPTPAARAGWAAVRGVSTAAAAAAETSSTSVYHEYDFRVGELQDAPPRLDGARCLLPLPSVGGGGNPLALNRIVTFSR